ncbi:hypothetical protein SDC9_138366 [bioreactor metagenome]|uniref:Uncharacterized protein n=1 Tax=bioreactor metagenome TaxID=1076179 RepID=A0A645DPU0_9ZZZZ
MAGPSGNAAVSISSTAFPFSVRTGISFLREPSIASAQAFNVSALRLPTATSNFPVWSKIGILPSFCMKHISLSSNLILSFNALVAMTSSMRFASRIGFSPSMETSAMLPRVVMPRMLKSASWALLPASAQIP